MRKARLIFLLQLSMFACPSIATERYTAENYLHYFRITIGCSAIAYLESAKSARPSSLSNKIWQNRSFAFARLAQDYYIKATGNETNFMEVLILRTQAMEEIRTMDDEQLYKTRTVCERHYADIDAICSSNGCIYDLQ